MIRTLLTPFRLAAAATAIGVNTVLHVAPLMLLALVKVLLPFERARVVVSRWLVRIAEQWIAVNSALIRAFTPTRVVVEGLESLKPEGWYLVLSNHQSWVDIPILQYAFNRRIPFLKFFLKRELVWVPLLGMAWWALDFPFMRRHSAAQLARNPALRGQDMAVTRKACERFKRLPVSVMNFVEGTRFTVAKHARQASPFQHLLKPKAGGVAFVMEAMGDILQSIVDVTIAYPGGRPSLVDLMVGRVREIRLHVRELPLPRALLGRSYETDPEARAGFQQWINALWQEKDARMAALLAAPAR